MDLLSALKAVLTVVWVIVFLFAAYKTIKMVPVLKAFLFIPIELIVVIGLVFVSWWGVDSSFKKARLTRFGNTPMPNSEKLALHGCVKNVGKYKINTVTLHIKVINNATSGPTSGNDGRDNTLEVDLPVVKNLAPSTQKCFKKRIKYPPYFKLANIQRHITAN